MQARWNRPTTPQPRRAELSDPFWGLLSPLLLPPRMLRPWQRPAPAATAAPAGGEGGGDAPPASAAAADVTGLQAIGDSFSLPDDSLILDSLEAAAAASAPATLSPAAAFSRGSGGGGGRGSGVWPRYDVLVGCLRLGGDAPACRLRWPAHALVKVRAFGVQWGGVRVATHACASDSDPCHASLH